MEKNEILNNLEYIEASVLFEYISKGVITLDELMDTGNLSPDKRKKIKELQDEKDGQDDLKWQQCGQDINKLYEYLREYPKGKHVESANERIAARQQMETANANRRIAFLNRMKMNINKVSTGEIIEALNNGMISIEDLMSAGLSRDIISFMSDEDANKIPSLDLGVEPNEIPDGYTEVYFWGSPGSGKTCALAAVLSTAEKMGYLRVAEGPGYNYAIQLKNLFINNINRLPAPSPTDITQYLPFALIKKNESRPVSMIELSGEIFECFLNKIAGRPFPTADHERTFEKISSFLADKNRKIHFFFIDYARGNKLDAKGYTQSDYLNAASTYFHNSKVFKNTTDSIYIVVTKSDMMKCGGGDDNSIYNARVEECKNLLDSEESGYKSFKNVMKKICHDEHINARKLMVEPFSLGEVYLSDICVFNPDSSKRILDIMIDKIQPVNESRLQKFLRQ